MKRIIHQARGYLLLALTLLFVEYSITGVTPQVVIVIFTFITFAVSLPLMNRLPQVLSIVMLAVGHVLFFRSNGTLQMWLDALMSSLPFVVLFVTVPLLSIPIRIGGYIDFISGLLNKYASRAHTKHAVTISSSFVLGSLLNIGALRIMNELFGRSYQGQKGPFIQSITRGFSVSAMFSPYIAGIAIILIILHVPLYQFMIYSFIIALFGILVSTLLSFYEQRKMVLEIEAFEGYDEQKSSVTAVLMDGPRRNRIGKQLLFAFVVLLVLIILLEQWLTVNLVVIIGLIGFTFPFLWTVCIRQWRRLPEQIKIYEKQVLPNVHNESVLVVTASFFSAMVQLSPIVDVLHNSLVWITDLSVIFMAFLMIVVVLLLTICCIHQIIPVTIFANTIASQPLDVDPMIVAISLAVAWGLAGLTGPISALTITSNQLFQVSWYQLIRWNGNFIICMIGFATLFVAIYQLC